MNRRKILSCAALVALLFLSISHALSQTQTSITTQEPRDEKLWRKAQEIHRRAIVIDTHNDVTTPMVNDDYDLSGTPPVPYRTSLERMRQGGMTAEFF